MKRSLFVCMVLSVFASSAVLADEAMAKAKNCLACHAVASKLVGPSFKDVAAKYAGQAGAEAKLVQKVLHGSNGAWGGSMPPNPQVNEAEAGALVKWILTQK